MAIEVEKPVDIPPRGPHIHYPYFSAYFPGSVRAFVISRLLEADAPSMMHPVTGLQFAEHQEPLAMFLGKYGFPLNALDLAFLKRYDNERGVSTELPRLGL